MRHIYEVAQVEDGWRVANLNSIKRLCADQQSALVAGDCLALARHLDTGEPTGVSIVMEDGDCVMVETHG